MKAIVVRTFGGPEVMQVEDAEIPVPGAGQAAIRVGAVGVNPVDAYIRSGNYARKPSLPYIPGTDVAGTIEQVGAGVTRLRPGDRVYAHGAIGGAAEIALCDEWQAHSLPARVSFAQGAALGVPYATAWRALFIRAHAKPADSVLVHGGSGGVGTAAIQMARAHGLTVIATAGTEKGLALVRSQGAHHALNHRGVGYLQQVAALTDGRGVDIVLEMLANVNLDHDLDVLAPGGRVVVIGNRGRVEIDPRKAMAKDAAILGMTVFNTTRAEFKEIHAGLVAGLESGWLSPVVAREMPLAEAPAAHVAVLEPGAMGKIVLLP
jgi:NADPH2:quinone reductase